MNRTKPRSLYVHVPFCARRCSYCDFAVEVRRDPPVDEWLEAVATEMALTAAEQGWNEPLRLDTLYIGGGTPSLLGSGAMARLIERLAPFATLAAGAEWTCEANPESFSLELARDWESVGVTRISLGTQTFHADTLGWMGRLHGPAGPGRALAVAREAGFRDVNIDLIFALPERLDRDWSDDLQRAIALAPEHISLYGLTAEPGAPLGRWVAEGREALADEDRYAYEYLLAHQLLTDAGYEHYEVSNYASDGRRSRHNVVYWTGAPYAALGPGAHAFFPPVRRWNLRSWTAYREALLVRHLPVEGQERLEPAGMHLERVWLGLRTERGYDMTGATGRQEQAVGRWVARGLAELAGAAVRLTPRGWLLLDQLAVELDEAGEVNEHLSAT